VAKNGSFVAAAGDVVVAAFHVGEGGIEAVSGSRLFAGGAGDCAQVSF
jgi:hypothetical protein